MMDDVEILEGRLDGHERRAEGADDGHENCVGGARGEICSARGHILTALRARHAA